MKLQTGISPKYVKGWDIPKAIREVIQNYLDSRKEFECDGYINQDQETGLVTVKDYGPGLELRHMALGISEKSGDAIGKYGEGLKLALLVMAREGRYIEVKANGKIIRPEIEKSEGYGTEVLVLKVEDMEPCHAALHIGTTIRFECTREELESGKQYFEAYLTAKSGFRWMEQGKISLPAGYIYINGARVGNIENALFSYHLNESETGDIGNRDREVIDQDQLKSHVRHVLAHISSLAVMKELIAAAIDNPSAWEIETGINHYCIPHNSKRVWKRAANEVLGADVVLGGNEEADREASYKGHQVVHIRAWAWDMALQQIGVKTSAQAAQSRATIHRVAIQNLTGEERSVLNKARKIVKENYNEIGKLAVAESLAYKTGDATLEGLYDRREDRIYIKRSVLQNLAHAVHVLLHEAVHKYSRADDCTSEFERALTDVAVRMMLK